MSMKALGKKDDLLKKAGVPNTDIPTNEPGDDDLESILSGKPNSEEEKKGDEDEEDEDARIERISSEIADDPAFHGKSVEEIQAEISRRLQEGNAGGDSPDEQGSELKIDLPTETEEEEEKQQKPDGEKPVDKHFCLSL